jgi:hypothetical protein
MLKFVPSMGGHWRYISIKTRIGTGLTHAERRGAKLDRKTDAYCGIFLSLCGGCPKAVLCPRAPMVASQKRKKLGSTKVNTCRDIWCENQVFEKNQVDFQQKTRDALTFFDRFSFHIRHPYGAISGQKTPFGLDPHMPRKHQLGLQLGLAFSTPKCVPTGKCSMAHMEPWMCAWVWNKPCPGPAHTERDTGAFMSHEISVRVSAFVC